MSTPEAILKDTPLGEPLTDFDELTLGELIDEMYGLRTEKRVFEEQIKILNRDIEEISFLVSDKMNELGVTTIRSTLASASLTQQVVPQIDDFDAVLDWINEDFEGRKHIMQRRVAVKSWRELEKLDSKVPGITPYTKHGVGLRKLQS